VTLDTTMNTKTHNDPEYIIGAKEVEELKKQGWKYASGGLELGNCYATWFVRPDGHYENVFLSKDMSRWPDEAVEPAKDNQI
jgi:hypothetical protein